MMNVSDPSLLPSGTYACNQVRQQLVLGRSSNQCRRPIILPVHTPANRFGAEDGEPPRPPVTTNVRDYGAAGDGASDDSDAFEAAVRATPRGGVVFFPAGTYRLTRTTRIWNAEIVIRGAGRDETTLYYPYSQKVVVGQGNAEGM